MKVLIQKQAGLFRERSGISASEPIRLKSLLLKLNVLTLFRPLSEGFSGMSLKTDNARFMLVNSNHSLGRQHFTIGHELYHLFVQEKFEFHFCNAGVFETKNKEEYKADYFAACLLMPENGIHEIVPDEELNKNISLPTLVKLEQYFSVSRSSMLLRLKMLNLIGPAVYDKYKALKVIETARQYGYETSLYKKGNSNLVIGDYGEKAKKLFEREKISEGHRMELMRQIGIDIMNPEPDEE